MADKKKKNLPPDAQKYQAFQQKRETKRNIVTNCVKAFFVGGLICVIGQTITTLYIPFFAFTEQIANKPTVATLIFITRLLTCLVVYDLIVLFAIAGAADLVTGFDHSVT